jgi:N-acyl-phosphatidylethanolamine-hydrolysing phospholipase D
MNAVDSPKGPETLLASEIPEKSVRVESMTEQALGASRPAHHDLRGGYRNPWPSSPAHGFGSFLKWILTRKRRPTGPDILRSVVPNSAISRLDDHALSVTWIGHSTFLIRSAGISVLTDPIWSERASPVPFAGPRRHTPPGVPLEELPPVNAVFISHDHYDHLDDATTRFLIDRYPLAKWITPLGVSAFFRKRGARDVIELDWWESYSFGEISAFCTPARHFSGRYPWNRNATLWSGWVIGLGDRRVFFAGDTAFHPDFADIAGRFGPLDAAILPIGAYDPRWFMQAVHMNPEEAVAAWSGIAETAGNDECVFIPSHWGTFRLTDEPLDEPPRRLRNLWSRAGFSPERLWLLAPGETRWHN